MIKKTMLLILCLLALLLTVTALLLTLFNEKRFIKIAIAIDQAVNASTGGHEDETISSRAYKSSYTSKKWFIIRHLIDFLFSAFEADHCYNAYKNELLTHKKWIKSQKNQEKESLKRIVSDCY